MRRVNDKSMYESRQTWVGRSLANYKAQHPKAKDAVSLTEARRMAFGAKPKSFTCKCGQFNCQRDKGGSPHC